MRQKSGPEKQPAEDAIRDIRRATSRYFSAEEKIRIVLEGLRGEESIAELCRRIASSMYYGWSKEFLEAGKRRLAGDTARRGHCSGTPVLCMPSKMVSNWARCVGEPDRVIVQPGDRCARATGSAPIGAELEIPPLAPVAEVHHRLRRRENQRSRVDLSMCGSAPG